MKTFVVYELCNWVTCYRSMVFGSWISNDGMKSMFTRNSAAVKLYGFRIKQLK